MRVVYATAGDGWASETVLAQGRAIGALRSEETPCAAHALGEKEPVVRDLGDGRLGEITRPPAATLAGPRHE